ncbi:MAG: hypothetical protein WAM79_04410 [Candidatus Sulfotelmatobacter sp.]
MTWRSERNRMPRLFRDPAEPAQVLVETYSVNDAMNQLLWRYSRFGQA